MTELDLNVPPNTDFSWTAEVIENFCATKGLRMTLKGTSQKFPGSVHWHFKKGKKPGTLEITLWPKGRRLWFSMQDGRRAPWVEEMMAQGKTEIERRLR